MSKKSRKRNKKILAAIGIGLGAAAMASKRKANLASTEDGKSAKADRGFTMADVANTAKKKDTVVKTPTTIQDNKPAKRSNASIAGDFITKVNNPKTMESGMQMSNDLVNYKLPSRTRTPIKADNSGIIRQYKSGGRANYKHGGSTGSSKSSGCEIRGTSPILMKGKR